MVPILRPNSTRLAQSFQKRANQNLYFFRNYSQFSAFHLSAISSFPQSTVHVHVLTNGDDCICDNVSPFLIVFHDPFFDMPLKELFSIADLLSFVSECACLQCTEHHSEHAQFMLMCVPCRRPSPGVAPN